MIQLLNNVNSGVVKNQAKEIQHQFKEYFRGKNYHMFESRDKIKQRINQIKSEIDKQATKAWQSGINLFTGKSNQGN